jgi:hypothetical protein
MKIRHLIAGAMMAAALPLGASAATVTIDGDKFDISFDDSLLGLFGTPSIIGDLVVWNPSGSPAFSAQATAADTTAFTNSTFTLTVTADPGWWITGAAAGQDGTYFSFGTSSQVGVTGALTITAADPMGGLGTWTGNIAATAPFVNGGFPPAFTDWDAASPVLDTDDVGQAQVSIQSVLFAYAGPVAGPKGAFIETTQVVLGMNMVPVPEPATWASMATGGILLGLALRRRNRKS